MRAAVVGARRRRQGTGAYIARELARLGCEVAGVVGTTTATVEEARADLAEQYGIACRGYTELAALLDAEAVDLVAVCSPADAHLAQVELALERGCHVLSEKPLWWTPGLEARPAAEVEARATRLLELARERGRLLTLNAQWPWTLPAFDALHPGVREEPLRSFALWMGPISAGPQAVADSGSHLLSMLLELSGPGELTNVRAEGTPAKLLVGARYRHARGEADVELRLTQTPTPPRPAGYSINGKSVDRSVELPSYRISFSAGSETVPLRDPLAACVEDFVRDAREGRETDRHEIVDGMTQLHQLVAAARHS